MRKPLVIIGCGGQGRDVHDVVDGVNAAVPTWDLLGYLDDKPDPRNVSRVEARGSTILGGVDWAASAGSSVFYVIGIADGTTRSMIDERLSDSGLVAAVLVHPAATIGLDVRLGAGTVIAAGARLSSNVELGRHVHVNVNSTVGHDCTLAEYVTVLPLAAVSGDVSVGRECLLGTHSTILQGLQVGERSVVGAGACVVRDVPSDVIVKGIPAR